MSVTIKVGMRCRPFVCNNPLGVNLQQEEEQSSSVEVINSKYSKNRFAFTWSWWSAYGWERRVEGDKNKAVAESMTLVNQKMVFEACGPSIKGDLLDGNAVVLFAYGLSGSGKTFTVFGPDDPAAPVAWFKHEHPTDMWGVFPNMAYQIFNEKQDGWKISMKYFQNVVDIVRDLMSPTGEEKQYKQGMRKDKDGFMDVQWCASSPLGSWDELRSTFQVANGRKAIAPTQFNHQSTRGHCIMTLEVEKPHPTEEGVKQRGRLYVCDLAGTEPAGDIVYAKYKHVKFPDGTVEHQYQGAHDDPAKTKQLQNQGKKINLSLSEMAQFFMKMASAIKKKKLKPGKGIPGCNSFFLCKFLKDTMLQAKTYLFCAIRPEVKFHPYTYSTLGFAKNASVVKLTPKKASSNMSKKEMALMKQLEELKALLAAGGGGGGGGGESDAQIKKLQADLEAKQKALTDALNKEGATGASADAQQAMLEEQKEEYGRRGIQLKDFFDGKVPHLINVDEDGFRNARFIYALDKEVTVFGPNNDVKPMSFQIVPDHCKITKKGSDCFFEPCNGDGYVNGVKLKKNEQKKLSHNDRVAFGNDLHFFIVPGGEKSSMTADDVAGEFRKALQGQQSESQKVFADQMKKFEMEKKKWEEERQKILAAGGDPNSIKKAPTTNDVEQKTQVRNELMSLVPKLKAMEEMLERVDRDHLTCEATMLNTLAKDSNGAPVVKVKVVNNRNEETIVLGTDEFLNVYRQTTKTIGRLQASFNKHQYFKVDEINDPAFALFDHEFQLGTAIFFIEFLAYNFDSEEDDKDQVISNVVSPHQDVGNLEVTWSALPPGNDGDTDFDASLVEEITEVEDLLGKTWNYKIKIKGAHNLAESCVRARCVYQFFDGESYTDYNTETLEFDDGTEHPDFNYSFVHTVEKVTQEFIDFLKEPFHVNVFIKPHISGGNGAVIDTKNTAVQLALTGKVQGEMTTKTLKQENTMLKKEVARLRKENNELKQICQNNSTVRSALEKAKQMDKFINKS
jgi:hypothetical protein